MGTKKITVIGGGTGTLTVLRGLKKDPEAELSAIVTMTDDGGSTGRLRDEFGILPLGDVRQCLIALAKEEGGSDNIIRELMLYRFPENESELSGHNFGNIFLTALTQILGSEVKAIESMSKILKVKGNVFPVTTDDVDLAAEYENGEVLVGESNIDEPGKKHDGTQKITKLWTQPKANANPHALAKILESDAIIMGPGDLYSSLLSNVLITGIPEAIQSNQGKFIYITNLMTRFGQTHNMTHSDHVAEIEKYTGRKPDFVLVNNSELPQDGLIPYAEEKSYPVVDDLKGEGIIRADLINTEIIQKVPGDRVKRSLIRHNSEKLAKLILELI